jgi:hypothetical protein
LKLSKEAQKHMKEIQALENKYGLIVFRAGLTHLVDTGHSNFDDESVNDAIKQVMEKGEADKANGVRSIITPEFQCEILRCSAELAKISVWTLFAYIKKYVDVEL